jgi:hypothetical protein
MAKYSSLPANRSAECLCKKQREFNLKNGPGVAAAENL